MHRGRLALALAAATTIAMVGCGGDDDDATDEPEPTSVQTDAPDDSFAGGDTEEPADDGSGSTPSVSPTSEPDDGSESEAAPPSVLRVSPTGLSDTLDPLLVSNVQSAFLTPTYEGLTGLDADSVPVPKLAESWQQDGTVYTFNLRQGVRFHDGAELTADAVAANFQRALDTPGPNSGMFANVEDIEVVDPMTLKITLSEAQPTFLIELALPGGMIVSPQALEAPDLDRNPVGTGPFTYNADASQDNRYVFDRNPDYWNAADLEQYPERVEVLELADPAAKLNALQAGEVDLAAVQGGLIAEAQAAGVRVDVLEPNRLLALNILDRAGEDVPPLGDERVRRALALAIDREAFVAALFPGGDGAPGMQAFAEGHYAFVPGLDEEFEYDPEQARQLLADAGYADGFEITIPTIPPFQAYAEALAGMLADVGITVNIEPITDDFPTTVARGTYAAFLAPHPYDDADTYRVRYLDPDASFNPKEHADETLQALGEEAAAQPVDQPDVRGPFYQDYYRRVAEQGYLIGVVKISGAVAVNENVVGDYDWPAGLLAPLLDSVVAAE